MIIEQGEITSSSDLLKLKVVDWNRLIDYWDSIPEAADSIASWLIVTRAHYSILRCDMHVAPKRDDWPGWNHVGGHPEMGQLFWNHFHWKNTGKLYFSDSPDFHGELQFPDQTSAKFYGDVGLVSAPTFMRSIKMLNEHDVWITVVDAETQIMIEPLGSIRQLWDNFLNSGGERLGPLQTSTLTQLVLF